MRALSLWQPWASLMAFGAKRYETRSYPTGVLRCTLAIHAAKKKDNDCLALCFGEPFKSALLAGGVETLGDLPFGAVLAVGKLIACHRVEDIRDTITEEERAFGDYRDGRFAWEWEIANQFATPIPAVGKQGFWFWDSVASLK